jgi:hypothetical protein
MKTIVKPRSFIVIDGAAQTYAHYVGNKLTAKVLSTAGGLSSNEVEHFRVDPKGFLGDLYPRDAA